MGDNKKGNIMDLRLLVSKTPYLKQKIHFDEEIKGLSFGEVKKNYLNVIEPQQYSTEYEKYSLLIITENTDYLQDQKNNIFLVREEDLNTYLNSVEKVLLEYREFYNRLLMSLSENNGLEEILTQLKEYLESNVCILSSSNKLVYNIFDFNKITQVIPLVIRKNQLMRRYALLGFEELKEEYIREAEKLGEILGGVLYDEIIQLINHGDVFYEAFKTLLTGAYNHKTETAMDLIGWDQKDDYTLITVKLEGGRHNYQEIFLNGNRFRLDHPMFLYTIIAEERLVLLMNESFEELEDIKKETFNLLDEFELKYMEVSLRNNILNVNEVFQMANELLEYGGENLVPIDNYIYDIIFDWMVRKKDLSLFVLEDLLKMIEEDLKDNTQLVKTLYYYLLEERSLMKAGEVIGVHRNSIVYRMNKIEETYNFNLEDREVRKNLIASLELFKRKHPEIFRIDR